MARQYLNYWLHALDQHSLQSPFVYNLYTKVIHPDDRLPVFQEIELLRLGRKRDGRTIRVNTSLGAASLVSDNELRTISSIARHSLSAPRFSRLLYRLASFIQPRQIIELGTSLGINTLYLSAAVPHAQVITFEGCAATASLAADTFATWKFKNIQLVQGNIDKRLPEFLATTTTVDLVYVDANHRFEPTVRYFELLLNQMSSDGILIFDDIHWSAGMEAAWKAIKQSPRVSLTIDIFDAGLVFIKPMLTKQQYVLEY